ncbi:Telomere capping, CST complex subunit [Teratosphaeria destructans]|uniref:Telomere capping, CST complex subunit n=1 Tax=Teratosphaeria destructans TaxID=418781 RepID=A0A9W7W3E4_9PEZI|nr:Telomere capping, CST complex subunit [Teratosphaeria destructans]
MPEPSRLVALDQLSTLDAGSKVRFLGCVHSYDGNNAVLVLRAHYPVTSPDAPTALVHLENILESMKHDLLGVGSWLNVVGSIMPQSKPQARQGHRSRKHEGQATFVEATLVWSAGAIKLEKYEEAVKDVQSTAKVIPP